MSVYFVAEMTIHEPEQFRKYLEAVEPIILSYSGKYIVRGGNVTSVFGGWKPERFLIIEFESLEKAQNCFASDEYKRIAHFRENATTSQAFFVEGVNNPQ